MIGQFFEAKANVDNNIGANLEQMSSEISEIHDHVRYMSQHAMNTTQMVNAILLQQQTLTNLIVPLIKNS